MKIKPTHRVYIGTHFIVSGHLFYIPGIIKLPDENIKKWGHVEIPGKDLKRVYFWLELKRKIKGLFK